MSFFNLAVNCTYIYKRARHLKKMGMLEKKLTFIMFIPLQKEICAFQQYIFYSRYFFW